MRICNMKLLYSVFSVVLISWSGHVGEEEISDYNLAPGENLLINEHWRNSEEDQFQLDAICTPHLT